jgi:hypothetical protein
VNSIEIRVIMPGKWDVTLFAFSSWTKKCLINIGPNLSDAPSERNENKKDYPALTKIKHP